MTGSASGGGGGEEKCRILHGDAAEELSRMEAESVRCVCTDPPYGVGVAGQKWDRRIPSAGVWKECARVMEPGAFAFVMCSPRQDVSSRMIASLDAAGLDVSYPPILWTTATGFSHARSAAVVARRFGRERDVSGMPDVDGSYLGYMPRPAVELVLVCMRPTRGGRTLIDQYADNGLAVTHLDDCRIPYAGDEDKDKMIAGYYVPADGREVPPGAVPSRDGRKMRVAGSADERGRYPSNLLCTGGALDDGRPHGDARGTYSRYFDLDAWAAEHITPAVTAAPKPRKGEREGGMATSSAASVEPRPTDAAARRRGDGGGNGNGGSNGRNGEEEAATPYNRNSRRRLNNHPAVKPIALFAYLMHLGSRPGDTVLDPFAGTGTAALAASMTGRRCIGIERSGRYVSIARTRIREYATNVRLEAFA